MPDYLDVDQTTLENIENLVKEARRAIKLGHLVFADSRLANIEQKLDWILRPPSFILGMDEDQKQLASAFLDWQAKKETTNDRTAV